MDFRLTEEQQRLLESVDQFIEQLLSSPITVGEGEEESVTYWLIVSIFIVRADSKSPEDSPVNSTVFLKNSPFSY